MREYLKRLTSVVVPAALLLLPVVVFGVMWLATVFTEVFD